MVSGSQCDDDVKEFRIQDGLWNSVFLRSSSRCDSQLFSFEILDLGILTQHESHSLGRERS